MIVLFSGYRSSLKLVWSIHVTIRSNMPMKAIELCSTAVNSLAGNGSIHLKDGEKDIVAE